MSSISTSSIRELPRLTALGGDLYLCGSNWHGALHGGSASRTWISRVASRALDRPSRATSIPLNCPTAIFGDRILPRILPPFSYSANPARTCGEFRGTGGSPVRHVLMPVRRTRLTSLERSDSSGWARKKRCARAYFDPGTDRNAWSTTLTGGPPVPRRARRDGTVGLIPSKLNKLPLQSPATTGA
jgi:hypothetical protein